MTSADWDALLTQTDGRLSLYNYILLLRHHTGYSGSDIATCVADALLEPVRELEHAKHWKLAPSHLYTHNMSLTTPTGGCGPMYVPCSHGDVGAKHMALSDIPPQQVRSLHKVH